MIYFYGGAFDPITVAHIDIMKAIHKQLRDTDQMYIAVSNNDEKNYHEDLDNRSELVTAMVHEKFKDNTPVVMHQDRRTLAFLWENFQNQDVTICVGEDEWKAILAGKWVNSETLLKKYSFIVIARQSATVDTKSYKANVITIEGASDISSTKTREILYRNPLCHYEDVQKYITHKTFRQIKDGEMYKQNSFDYEKECIAAKKKYDIEKVEKGYSEPSVTADVLAYNGNKILLIRRKKWPYKNFWAVPGGFFNAKDTTEHGKFVPADLDLNYAAAREFREETTLDYSPDKFHQIHTYAHNFDPRLRVVDTAFAVRINAKDMNKAVGSDDADEARWFELNDLPELAFHHKQIIEDWLKTRR